VVAELIGAGLSGETPAAVVTKATTKEQDQLTGPLKNIPQLIKKHGFTPPSVIIIGHVVDSGSV
jgi:siroheme synthase